jgi:hypothetical protein
LIMICKRMKTVTGAPNTITMGIAATAKG